MTANVTYENTSVAAVHATDTLGVAYLTSSCLVMVSNGIVVVVVVKSLELHRPTMWNIAFMAICDFLYGLHYFIFAAPSAFLKMFPYPDFMVSLGGVLLPLLIGQNMLNVMVASVDRYLFLCWPLKYPRLMSGKRFIYANFITFGINIVHVCFIAIPDFDARYIPFLALPVLNYTSTTSAVAVLSLTLSTSVVIVTVLLKITLELVRSRRRVHPVAQDTNARSLCIAMTLSASIFCLGHLPSCGLIVWVYSVGLMNVPRDFINFAIFCLVSISLWNVVLYGGVYKPFRLAFLRLFCPGYHRRKMQRDAVGERA